MSTFEIVISITNIVAVILVPIVAVVVGQRLQDRSEKRKDKLEIFKLLMVNRPLGWTVENFRALNIIDVVFSDNLDVREKWKSYHGMLCIQNPDSTQQEEIQIAKGRLLESMANSLGYKGIVTQETIKNSYMPIGMSTALQQQQTIQEGQVKLAEVVDQFAQMMSRQSVPNVAKPQEDKSHADT